MWVAILLFPYVWLQYDVIDGLLMSCQGYIFVDRDGKHFRHILNWLRDGVVPTLSDSEYAELLREAEYYQLLVSNVLSFLVLVTLHALNLLF